MPNSAKKEYLSERGNDHIVNKYIPKATIELFKDKRAFNLRFKNYIKRGWMAGDENNLNELLQFCKDYEKVIIKPLSDYGGHGVKVLTSLMSENEIKEILSEYSMGFIVEECIVSKDEIRKLAPGSLNTLRIVTIVDKSHNLHILAALLRLGDGKGIMDNFHAGGIAVPIDIKTGKLQESGFSIGSPNIKQHPFTGIEFKDFEVPGFFDCVNMLDDLVKIEPSARYVGWDFCITPRGIEILEANIPPGEDITQLGAGRGLRKEITDLLN